ncbi:hypothetical protein PFICI_11645 [Pestalotiopsis fici W106-1]|uniref:Uncharacterized protein n=1 Tax=Pestalotiopsis fici (strain W106-1 / CGMCC3.15140) TaxID=1229662 RepID=W3WQZ4_PESFW|nr:uncharacterized protein PFICI_11645 [Pestalotiopsis fici W106-1]ETS76258.1 hypothetical protein PFICI_11645 [Pestalotiopsis fici W106-1]
MDTHAHDPIFFGGTDLAAGTLCIDQTGLLGAPAGLDSSIPFGHDLPSVPTQLAAGLPTESLLPQRSFSASPRQRSLRRPSFGRDVLTFAVDGAPAAEAVVPREGKIELVRGKLPKITRKYKKREQLEDDSDDDIERSKTADIPINPQDYYGRPAKSPKPWGWMSLKRDECTFRYNELGEFAYTVTFSKAELQAYFDGHPPKRHGHNHWVDRQLLPGERIRHGKTRSGLTLWIGWTPAHANSRYPSAAYSNKCRFYDCPVPNRTFRGGCPRVAFDERMNTDGRFRDPYHVAGYVHLFCLEQHFDIIKLMETVDIRLDMRIFQKEENLAGFHSRPDQETKIQAACDWLSSEWPRKVEWDHYLYNLNEQRIKSRHLLTREQAVRPRHFDDSLTKKMVETDFNNYTQSGSSSRESRKKKGNADGKKPVDAGEHLGNIEYVAAERRARSGKRLTKKLKQRPAVFRDDRFLQHRVYAAEHFTRGFVPGRQGPSDRDALGRPRRGFKPEPFVTPESSLLARPQHVYPAQGYTFPSSDPQVTGFDLHPSMPTSFPSNVPSNQLLPDFSQLLEGHQKFDMSDSKADETSLVPNELSQKRPKRAREHDISDVTIDQVALAAHGPQKRQRRNTEWTSPRRSLLPSQCRRDSTQLGKDREQSPECFWSMPRSGPVLCMHRGSSPVDFNSKYRTLSLKRKWDEGETRPGQEEGSSQHADSQPPRKKSCIDALLPSELERNISPNALTDMDFHNSLANFNPDFNFPASDFDLMDMEQDLALSDEQLHLLFQSAGPGDTDHVEGTYDNCTAEWFEEQLAMTGDLGQDLMPPVSNTPVTFLESDEFAHVKSEDALSQPALDGDTNPQDEATVQLPSVAASKEQLQEIAHLENTTHDKEINGLSSLDEPAEPSPQTPPPHSGVLDTKSVIYFADKESNHEEDDIDDLFNEDLNE